MIDTANLTSIDALPTNLISQAMVFDAESEDPENEPLATKEAEEIDLKTFVGEKISPVEGLEKEFEQDVHWRDNNDLSGRPTSPQEFAGGVRLQFYIGNTEPTDDSGWTTLTAETMGQLGLTAETLPPGNNEQCARGCALGAYCAGAGKDSVRQRYGGSFAG